MPIEVITNAVSTVGSLTLLLNPTPRPEPEAAPPPAPPAEIADEHLFGDWLGLRPRWSEAGLNLTVQYIGEVAGNVSGGERKGVVYHGLVNLAGDLDLQKLAGWSGGLVHAAMLVPHGRSLTEHYVHDLFVLSNLDATDNVRLFEFWLEQNFAAGKYSARLGQMAVDQEFAFVEQGALFNNSTFGWFGIAGNNITAPIYPQGAPGIRLKWQPDERAMLQFAVVDGEANPLNAAGQETNPHGTEFRFAEGALLISEFVWSWTVAGGQQPGLLKSGGWYHTANTSYLRRDDGGRSLADPLSSGTPATLRGNWGFYLAAEQLLWKESPEDKDSAQGVGCFSRIGYAPADRNPLGFYAEGGLTRTGWLPGRDNDICGLAVAYGRLSHDLQSLGAESNFYNSTALPLPDYELVIEADYQIQVSSGFAVQPTVEYIVHPGGSHAIADAIVVSLRTYISF